MRLIILTLALLVAGAGFYLAPTTAHCSGATCGATCDEPSDCPTGCTCTQMPDDGDMRCQEV